MGNVNAIRGALGTLYAVAIIIALFVGGLIPVIIVGAILLGLSYRFGPRAVGTGRQRNRNRNRDRS
jgi:hypothetical protein